MTSLEIARNLLSALLAAILAFSPTLAGFIAPLSRNENDETTVIVIPPEKHTVSDIFDAFDDLIRARLRDDERYQQASVIGALPAAPLVSEAARIEDALVNIFCTARGAEHVRTVTGSGVFIDARGIILTNAHIAQFLLLTEDVAPTTVQCVVRQGNPALSKYEAGLIYISPEWIIKNAPQFNTDAPVGTGERDFALLYVTKAFEGDMPQAFPALAFTSETQFYDRIKVRAAGYPAEMLTANTTSAPLVLAVASTSITHLFTFGGGTVDLVSVAPSDVGKHGSSGGPVLAEDSVVVGIITTRGNPDEEGTQSLRALTLPYIDRTLKEETGLTLAQTLIGDIPLRAKIFHETIAPYLRVLLVGSP